MKDVDNHINYIELYASDLSKIKDFYSEAFGWRFTDYGDSYIAFEGAGLEGGFEKINEAVVNGALVVLYHSDLEKCKASVLTCGGKVDKDIFSFPGGERFEFFDPCGNRLAVWRKV